MIMKRQTMYRAGLLLAVALAVWATPAAADGSCAGAPAGTACDTDGSLCTPEQCDGEGKCVPSGPAVTCHGPASSCDGGKTCDPQTGACVDLPNTAAGTPCTINREKCINHACDGNGYCVATGPVTCDDGNPCTDDSCDAATGACQYVAAAGRACDTDNSLCTPEACTADGVCAPSAPPVTCNGPASVCDGGKTCDPRTGACADLPNAPAGTACTINREKCVNHACNGNGYCVASGPVNCDDGDVCTDDSCNESTGACDHVEDSSNDKTCSTKTDLAIEKDASCRCEATVPTCKDRGKSLIGPQEGNVPVVVCQRDEDKARTRRAKYASKWWMKRKEKCVVAYDITVTNKGAAATGIKVTDFLPGGIVLGDTEASQGTFNPSTGVWSVGSLDAGANAVLTIEVKTFSSSGLKGRFGDDSLRLKNCAAITAVDQTDEQPANDKSCVIVVSDNGR